MAKPHIIEQMRINYLNLRSGEQIPLAHRISVFVGPNNAGKSQTLKDIRCLMDKQQSPIKTPVILQDDNNCFEIPSIVEIMQDLSFNLSKSNVDHYTVEGVGCNLIQKNSVEVFIPQIKTFDNNSDEEKRRLFFSWFSKSYLALMDAETRLRLSSETSSFTPSESTPENLLQSLFLYPDIEKVLRDAFKDAFKQDIKLDLSQLTKLCVRVGDEVNQIPEDVRVAHKVAKSIPKMDSQGDGYRSFAGIVIGLLICKKRIILLDEPEAFLHPAQAFFLGKWVGEHCLELGSQLIICTHSSNFLSGILTGTKDLDIFRLSRKGDHTNYNLLSSAIANQLVSNPVLSSQRVVDGIFHSGVVICEADADRAVYQSVAAICHKSNREVLFIHAHNKQTLALVADVLKQTGTPVAVIADIDLLRPEKSLDEIYKVLAGKELEGELRERQKMLDEYIDNRSDAEVLQELKHNIAEFLDQLNKGEHTAEGAKGALSRIHSSTSKWSSIKRSGLDALNERQRDNAEKLIESLTTIGLFVVPVGELEGWISLGTTKKNKWIVPALDAIHNQKTPDSLSHFIGKVLAFFV